MRTAKDQDKIVFVFHAINNSDKVGDIKYNTLPIGTTMTITERATYYAVATSSRSTHSEFKVNKLTGKISGASHKHYARKRDEEPEWEIIGK